MASDPQAGRTIRELRLHGRGGQGTVKASEIIVLAAVREGLYANSLPYFGFERRGAPVSAFVRLDRQPIRPKTQVYWPDCVIVMDPTLFRAVNVYEGLRPGGTVVVNSPLAPSELPLPPGVGAIATVNATQVSLDILGRPVPNTVMLGAFAAATGWIGVRSLAEQAARVLGAGNAEAVEAGFERTRVVKPCVKGAPAGPVGPADRGMLSESPEPAAEGASPRRPATAARGTPDVEYLCPVGRDLYVIRTGEWRTKRPVFDQGKCTRCGFCLLYCPVGAVEPGEGVAYQVSLQYCKGCGICAHECPRGAITMVHEGGQAND